MTRSQLTDFSAHHPLELYIDRLGEIFLQAAGSPDPALFLYRHDARTSLFMAEAIARLLNRIYHSEDTERGLKLFKKLEDSLGQVDDSDHLVKKFAQKAGVKKKELAYFIERRDKQLAKLNKRLLKKDFYLEQLQELRVDLSVDLNDAALIARVKKEIDRELKDCYEFYKSCAGRISAMELQVHEIRRKLRWISMYAQSLQGMIRIKPSSKKQSWEKQFITQQQLDSPYCQLVVRSHLQHYIEFNREAFYALSFVIDELGTIKDKGMDLEAFAKMLRKTGDPKDAEAKAVSRLKLGYTVESQLKKADALLGQFFMRYKIHETLL